MKQYRIFALFAGAYFLTQLLRTVNAVVGPVLIEDTGVSAAQLGVLSSAFFLGFALVQLPVGLGLDRFGPRAVQLALLPLLAAGAWITAAADTFPALLLGRVLIGLGGGACLMSGFKAIAGWFPHQRLALGNGMLMAFGALGAVSAGAPLEALLGIVGWRSVFVAIGCAMLLLVLGLAATPMPSRPGGTPRFTELVRGLGAVSVSPLFLRVCPLYVTTHGVFLAFQSLWMTPWLESVSGVDHAVAARCVSLSSLTMAFGYLLLGTVADRLARRGVALTTTAGWGMAAFIVLQCAMAARLPLGPEAVWAAYGVLGGVGVLAYAIVAQPLPSALAGRSNALLNVCVFIGAFAFQSGIGFLLEAFGGASAAPANYLRAMAALIVVQSLTLAWYVLAPRILGEPRALPARQPM